MTLIDKAALLNRIATEVHYDSERSLEMYAKLLNEINDAPTVDAEPVVRCKDCKECEERHTANYLPFLYCKLHEHSVSYNAFCCWAERREDAKID